MFRKASNDPLALHASRCVLVWRELPGQTIETPVVRALSLTVGKGGLLQFGHDISKVVIAEPKIADAILVSPRDVMVNAKGAGQTTLVIWETDTRPRNMTLPC